ncbi:UNVERIFIED_ORG: hypothetical protein J2W85_000108 [Ensifer adhaerens]|nr:hypothetical protein [Ensifer adhaerens]
MVYSIAAADSVRAVALRRFRFRGAGETPSLLPFRIS